MGSIYVDNDTMQDIYVGVRKVKEIWIDTDKAFEGTPAPTYTLTVTDTLTSLGGTLFLNGWQISNGTYTVGDGSQITASCPGMDYSMRLNGIIVPSNVWNVNASASINFHYTLPVGIGPVYCDITT